MVRVVATAADRKALAAVHARASRRQLYTEPWRSTVVLALVGTGVAVAAIVWLARGPVFGGYLADIGLIVVLILLAGAGTMGPAARLTLPRTADGSAQAWLLQTSDGTAGLVIRDVDTRSWRPVNAVAHPPRRGLGRQLLTQMLHQADAVGATIRISCTRWLEPTYQRYGFVTVSRLLLWRVMERPPETRP